MTEQEIFLAAVEITDPQRRERYLEQACAGNSALRQQVEALLESHAAADDFLSTPAVQQFSAKSTAIDENRALPDGSAEPENTQRFGQELAQGDDELSLEFLTPTDKPGSLGRLGHYEVHEALGHGAFGIVLKAFDEKLHRLVAIKVLAPELAATSPPRKRFLREARAAAAIRHENVVSVYAVEEQPTPYLVMEYIPGLTLQQTLNQHGPLDVADVLRLGQQIAAGLAAAHARGLIHRDIKPTNILLENGLGGHVKITDFGLARAADDASQTQSGTIAGTPMYMSPEQATTGQIDQRSDLFSLGSVLYVMVSGRPPFRAANTLAVLKRVAEDMPRPIGEIIADTPAWLCAIIAKLQAKRPEDRFASAQEVADLLGRCLADLQANRPVQLPEGMPRDVEKGDQTAERAAPLSVSETLNRIPPSKPRGVLNQAWHDWWSERDRWVVLSVQNVLLVAYLVCMFFFVSMSSTSRKDDAGHKTFAYRLGAPAPWFQIEVYPQPTTPYQTRINPLSSSVFMGLLGCVAFYIYWRIEKVRNPHISPWQGPRFALGLWGAGAVFAVLMGLGMGLFVLGNQPAGTGTLVIEVDDPETYVTVTPRNVALTQRKGDEGNPPRHIFTTAGDREKITLEPGLYQLTEYRQGAEVSQRRVMVNRGEKVVAQFTMESAQREKPLELPGVDFAAERQVAEFVLSKNGAVAISDGSRTIWCWPGKPLPQAAFFVAKIDFDGRLTWTNDHLRALEPARKLQLLKLRSTNVTAAEVQQLAAAFPQCRIEWDDGVIEPITNVDREIAHLILSTGGVCRITVNDQNPREIDSVDQLPDGPLRLIAVFFHAVPVSSGLLQRLSELTDLRELMLWTIPKLDDEALPLLARIESLEQLDLIGLPISDAGLTRVALLPRLSRLTLEDCRHITATGLRSLTPLDLAALHVGGTQIRGDDWKLISQFTNLRHLNFSHSADFNDDDLKDICRLSHLNELFLGTTGISNDGLKHLSALANLTSLVVNYNPQLTDGAVEHLSNLVKLNQLDVQRTSITEEGIASLRTALPKCRIVWSGGVIEPRPESSPIPEPRLLTRQEREALQWVVTHGGRVTTNMGELKRIEDLPADQAVGLSGSSARIQLLAIDLRGPDVTDAAVATLAQLPPAGQLALVECPITDSGFSRLMDAPVGKEASGIVLRDVSLSRDGLKAILSARQLRFLQIVPCEAVDATTIGDWQSLPLTRLELDRGKFGLAEFAKLAEITTLQSLQLSKLGMDDAGFESVEYLRNLVSLSIDRGLPPQSETDTAITDQGLVGIEQLARLSYLDIRNHSLTDRGIQRLAMCRQLTDVWLDGNKLTQAGVDQLAAELPRCRIRWDGGAIEPTMFDDPDRTAAEWVLSLGGQVEVVVGDQRAMIEAGKELPQGPLQLVYVSLNFAPLGNRALTDAERARLQGLRHLQRLYIWHAQVSDADLACLRDSRNLELLYCHGASGVTDAGIAALQQFPKLRELTLNGAQVTGVGLKPLRNLKGLSLTSTTFTDEGIEAVAALTQLENLFLKIDIGGNPSRETLDGCLVPLTRLTRLRYLQTPQRVTKKGLEVLRQFPHLETISLNGAILADDGLTVLHGIKKLTRVDLCFTQVTQAGVEKLAADLPKCHIRWDGGEIEPRETAGGWHGWPADAPKPAIAPFDAEQAKRHQEAWAAYLKVPVEYTNSLGMKLRLIPPGEFLRGNTAEEINALIESQGVLRAQSDSFKQAVHQNHSPAHRTILTQPFYLAVHETTQQQFETVMGWNRSGFSKAGKEQWALEKIKGLDTANFPAETLNWMDAAEFCARLCETENLKPFYSRNNTTVLPLKGTGYRLPTEAQWEFACRAGTTTSYWSGDQLEELSVAGWFGENSGRRTHAVGELQANPFGLFDVHGNVWEWVQDGWDPALYGQFADKPAIDPYVPFAADRMRVVRGGGWGAYAHELRSMFRGDRSPSFHFHHNGFRVALSVEAVPQALREKPVSANPDRTAAEWALSIGIPVEIAVGNDKRTVQPGTTLPKEPFELRYADLRNPVVTDEGLAHFAGCRNLVSLHLSGPAVTDAGVANFKDCKKLTGLSLERTAVTDTGLALFEGCRELTHLILGGSPVSDAGLAAFQNCRELRSLQLGETRVTDAGLAHFRDCPHLGEIVLAYTQITDAGLVHFRNCRDLTSLNLIQTNVSDAGMENFRSCRELVQLTLDDTKVTDAGLANFRDCRKLTRLNLNNLGVTDAGLANFAQCADLTDLTLFGAKISDAGLAPFAKCAKLRYLLLDNTPVGDAGLAHLAACTALEGLHLDNTQITDEGMVHLQPCAKLGHLTLLNTKIGDTGLAAIKICRELTYVNLAGTQVTDAGINSLSGLPQLTELNLATTQVTDAGLDALKPLGNLGLLNLRKTDVTSAGVESLQQALPKCKIDW